MKFKIDQINKDLFKVSIKDNIETCHHVTLKDEAFQKLTQKKNNKKKTY